MGTTRDKTSTYRDDLAPPRFESRPDQRGHLTTVQEFEGGTLAVAIFTPSRITKVIVSKGDRVKMAAALLGIHPQQLADFLVPSSRRENYSKIGQINGWGRTLAAHIDGTRSLPVTQVRSIVNSLVEAARLAARAQNGAAEQDRG